MLANTLADPASATILRLPPAIGGSATHLAVPPDAVRLRDEQTNLVLARSIDDKIIVEQCMRNLCVQTWCPGGSSSFRVLRGMHAHTTGIPWPNAISVLPPLQIKAHKPWPCQLLQRLSRPGPPDASTLHKPSAWLPETAVLFSADFQFVTHPAFNRHVNAEPMIGSIRLFPTKHSLLGGIFCSCCRRVWQIAGTADIARCVEACGEHGMVDAHLQAAHSIPRKAENPRDCVPEADIAAAISAHVRVALADLHKNAVATDLVARFRYPNKTRSGATSNPKYLASRWTPVPTPGKSLQAGCIASLCAPSIRGGAAALSLFITPWHAENAGSDTEPARASDLIAWTSVVHARAKWTRSLGHGFSALERGAHRLLFHDSASDTARLLSLAALA